MLAVEGVVGPSTTTTATFPTPATMTMATTATAPTVVAAAGVGMIPLVTVATAVDPDPRSLLVPVSALAGSNPVGNSTNGSTNTPTTNTNNNNNTNTGNSNNPATMEQAEEFVKPIIRDGEILLEVECGQNKAAMYLSKLCQGSKGPCINFQGSWLTPNEFQFVSGRETAKDWKRSIRHHGKSLKLLLAKGILAVHPTMCDCEGCRIGAVLTRKGEKRRIPNGERKRKSTGNTPENSGNGAFRPMANLSAIKSPDGPSDAKRPALDKPTEGSQSPLKESTLLNLPAEAKEVCVVRQTDAHLQDVSKATVDSRLTSAVPLLPLPPSERGSCHSSSGLPSALKASADLQDSSAASSPGQPQSAAIMTPLSPSADVKVLSSSSGAGAAAITALDKSLSRLALYHAASASLKGSGLVGASLPEGPHCVPVPAHDDPISQAPISQPPMSQVPVSQAPIPQTPISKHETDSSDGCVRFVKDSADQSAESDSSESPSPPPPPPKEGQESPAEEEATTQTDAALSENEAVEVKECRAPDDSQTVIPHSIVPQGKLCEPNNNSSISVSVSVSTPLSLAASAAALTSPVIASAAPAASDSMPRVIESNPQDVSKDGTRSHTETAQSSSSMSSSSSSSSALLSPHNKHSEKEGHITIRHPSPERQPQEMGSPVKHSPAKPFPSKEHSAEKHKDRKHDAASSTSPEQRERHSSHNSKELTPSRLSHDREAERRRQEERAKLGNASGPGGSKADDSSSSRGAEPVPAVAGGVGRVEGVPTSTPMVPPVPVPAPVPDPAAFSEYMRVLAASHNGFVPPSVGCLPGMFPIRPPTEASLNTAAMMHPMQAAAACSMFSSPAALLPKDPVMYPSSAATLPSASYGYGAPGMTPLHLIPQQYSTTASAAMLDYPRPFPYLPWPAGIPLMMPDAMNAAAVAAAAAGSSAKRSREEMESAMDKRLQLPVPPYGMASVAPVDYMAAYRGLATPLSCGLESSMYDKNAELLRKRMYTDMNVGVAGGATSKGLADSPYLASLPEYYRALYCCPCMDNQPGDIRTWSVEEVVKLVSSLEGCSVYSEIFREQRVNGKILVLLTTEHLMKNLGMKLGPAMTLTSRVAKLLLDATRSSGCNMCQRLASITPAVQSAVGYS